MNDSTDTADTTDTTDAVSDDSTDTSGTASETSETEAPASSDEPPAPLATAGFGFGGLALLGGLVRLFLRIG